MRRLYLFSLLLLISLSYFSIGSLGLKTEDDCVIKERGADGEEYIVRNMNPKELILCYHEVAITYAYLENPGAGDASGYCEQIASVGLTSPDQRRQAETERNLCFKDIAVITANRNPPTNIPLAYTYCSRIQQEPVSLEPLAAIHGDAVTRSVCDSIIDNISKNNPSNYTCPFLFVFGGFILSFFVWQRIHDL